jgi:head-tail adaptor
VDIKTLAAYKLSVILREALESKSHEALESAAQITIRYLDDIIEAWRLLNTNLDDIRGDIDEDIMNYLKKDGLK